MSNSPYQFAGFTVSGHSLPVGAADDDRGGEKERSLCGMPKVEKRENQTVSQTPMMTKNSEATDDDKDKGFDVSCVNVTSG